MLYYLKYEQQCFIKYKDTRRRRVSLGVIKHACTANVLNCFKNDRSRKFISEVIFKNTLCNSRKSKLKFMQIKGNLYLNIKIRHALMIFLCVFLINY